MCLFNIDNAQQFPAAHNCAHKSCNFITLIQKEFQIENLTPQQIIELLNHFNLLDHPALNKAFNGDQHHPTQVHNFEHQIIHQNYANELQEFIENNLQKCLEKISSQQDFVKPQQQKQQLMNILYQTGNMQNQLFNSQMVCQKPEILNQFPQQNTYQQNQQQYQAQSVQNNEKAVQQITLNCLDKLLENSAAQTKMLSDIQKSQNSFESSLSSLIDSVSILKNFTHQIVKSNDEMLLKHTQFQMIESTITPITTTTTSTNTFDQQSQQNNAITNTINNMNSQNLLKFLNPQTTSFQYKLVLTESLSLPLSREKNFNINIQLVNKFNEKIANSNRIPLSIQLFTCDNPPKRIEFNRTGQNVLKGVVEKDLVNGCAKFDKIHIKEVTSHFRNGWIFIVVYTKKSSFVNQSLAQNNAFYSNVVDYEDIQPLIIQQVKIRAKPLKEEKLYKKSLQNFNDNISIDRNNIQIVKQISNNDYYIQKQIKKSQNNEICVQSN